MMNMREYQPEDLEFVMALANQAWQPIRKMSREELGDRISDILNPAGDALSKGIQLKEQIDSKLFQVAICEYEGKPVGFITYRITGDTAEIGNNAADVNAGVKGIGQTMYRYAIDRCRAAGAKVLTVLTGLDWAHAPARRAYERAGFTRKLESVRYYMELD